VAGVLNSSHITRGGRPRPGVSRATPSATLTLHLADSNYGFARRPSRCRPRSAGAARGRGRSASRAAAAPARAAGSGGGSGGSGGSGSGGSESGSSGSGSAAASSAAAAARLPARKRPQRSAPAGSRRARPAAPLPEGPTCAHFHGRHDDHWSDLATCVACGSVRHAWAPCLGGAAEARALLALNGCPRSGGPPGPAATAARARRRRRWAAPSRAWSSCGRRSSPRAHHLLQAPAPPLSSCTARGAAPPRGAPGLR